MIIACNRTKLKTKAGAVDACINPFSEKPRCVMLGNVVGVDADNAFGMMPGKWKLVELIEHVDRTLLLAEFSR